MITICINIILGLLTLAMIILLILGAWGTWYWITDSYAEWKLTMLARKIEMKKFKKENSINDK